MQKVYKINRSVTNEPECEDKQKDSSRHEQDNFVSLIYDKKCREIMNAILDPKCTCEAAAEKSVSLSLFYSIPVKLVSTKYRYPKKWCKSGLAK